jgi:multicomponent Na+:H+ antiporter subunit D
MLAYSAIGQVGYVLIAIAVGAPAGIAAAILYTIVNAANKTMLFLTTEHRGVIVGGLFALGALSIAGVPPAAGFVGKLGVFRAVIDSPVLVVVVLAGSLLSFVYAFQIYQFERWRPGGDASMAPTRWQQWVVPIMLGALILGLGMWPEPLIALSDAAAGALSGPMP